MKMIDVYVIQKTVHKSSKNTYNRYFTNVRKIFKGKKESIEIIRSSQWDFEKLYF